MNLSRGDFNPWTAGWRFHVKVFGVVVVLAFIASRFVN